MASDSDSLLEDLEEHAKGLIKSMVDIYQAFDQNLDEVTHTGKFAPTAEEPTRAFNENRSKELVSDIKRLGCEMVSLVKDWKDFEASLRQVDSTAKSRISKIRGDAVSEHGSLAAIEDPEWTSGVPDSQQRHRDRRLRFLTDATKLADLFRRDNEAWEEYGDPVRWLANIWKPEDDPRERAERRRDAALPMVRGLKREKSELRDAIRRLFPVFDRDKPASSHSDSSSSPSESGGRKKRKRRRSRSKAPSPDDNRKESTHKRSRN